MERTGHPQIDALIEAFEQSNPEIEDVWIDIRNEMFKREEPYKRLGDLRFDKSRGRDQLSRKNCGAIADLCDAFMKAHGVTVISELDQRHPTNLVAAQMDPNPFDLVFAGELDIESGLDWSQLYGYEDGKYRRRADKTHQATVIEHEGEVFAIDWAAGQYGFQEWPMVQRFDLRENCWQRQWEMRPRLEALETAAEPREAKPSAPSVAGPALS
jgi:hypothetical protein